MSKREKPIHYDFTKNEVGCYAVGEFFKDFIHLMNTLADLVEDYDKSMSNDLRQMPDYSLDGWESDEPLQLLQSHTESGLEWVWDKDGIFLLEKDKK